MFRKMRRIDKQMPDSLAYDFLQKAEVGVLATQGDDNYPYAIAVNYVVIDNKIYFHTAKDGHKIDNIKKHKKVCFMVYDNVEIVGEDLNTLYESVVVFGKAKVLEATEEILMALIKKYSDVDMKIAQKMIDKEIDITGMVEITIDHITGKKGK